MRPYQSVACDAFFDGVESHRAQLLVMATGLGKCLGAGTPVLMYDGTIKAVEGVEAGDLLMGPDSRPRRVLSLARGREMMYTVTPKKGDPYRVNESHILSLMLTPKRRGGSHELVNLSVADYLAESATFRHRAKGWRAAVDWPEQGVPLDPYYLGAWLGDGTRTNANVSKPDSEVGLAVASVAEAFGLRSERKQYGDKCPTWTIAGSRRRANPVTQHLGSLGVSHERHVPLTYKANARHVRLQVLAGLMDTDGHMACKGFDFISASRRLAHDVAFLARSLGLAAYVKPCSKGCQGGFVGRYWRVAISGNTDIIPTRIARKQASPRRQIKDVTVVGVDVKPDREDDYYGFEIDGDRLFMLGDFTVTHNTVVMSEIARRWREDGHPGRVMLIAHREELVSQAVDKLERVTGQAPGVEMAELRGGHFGGCAVATVQTLSARLNKFRPDEVGLLMIDEAHHAVASSYRKVIGHFEAAKILGVTATPRRADEIALGKVFGHCCYDYGIAPAIEDGWLVEVAQKAIKVESLDFSAARQTCGDINEGDLEDALRREKVLHEMAAPIVAESGDRPTLVFAVTVRHAHELAAVVERYKPNSAVALHGKTPKDVRREQVERFRRGEIQYLINCGLFLEGFDAPATACVAMCRPTKSLALYMQVLGRGTRPLPGVVDGIESEAGRVEAIRRSGKPDVLVLDFVGNSGRHKIVTAVDVLGGKHTVQAREYAQRLNELEDRPATVPDALARAEAEMAFLRELHEMRRLRDLKAQVAYSSQAVDPFQGGLRGKAYYADRPQGEMATDKQVRYLVWRAGWKHADAAKLTKKQASAVIGKHREAEDAVGGGSW